MSNIITVNHGFNKIYQPLFTTKARFVDIWGGRGGGRSYAGTNYLLIKLLSSPYKMRGFLVRQNFGTIRTSLWQDMLDRIESSPHADIIKKDLRIVDTRMHIEHIPTGNTISSLGVMGTKAQTGKLKSLAGATDLLIEEADEIGENDFDQINVSLRTTESPIKIIRLFNPPGKDHWWWKRFYTPKESDVKDWFMMEPDKGVYYKTADGELHEIEPTEPYEAIPKICSIFATYKNNYKNIDALTRITYESYAKTRPEYYNGMIRGLVSKGMQGAIYHNWQKITNDEFNAIEARSIFGLDFGTASPAALVECKLVKNKLYLREHNYEGKTAKQIGELLLSMNVGSDLIIADSAEPISIQEIRNMGFNIVAAMKAPGSIVSGINKIKDLEVYATEDSKDLWIEFIEYRWALDKNKNPTDDPIDMFNHLMDAIRYIILGKGRVW